MRNHAFIICFSGLCLATILITGMGCQKKMMTDVAIATDSGGMSESAVITESVDARQRGGALMWSQNCMRCHNLRQPRERSDREWELIVHHMRVRANLTAEEHRLIVQFLQSAN